MVVNFKVGIIENVYIGSFDKFLILEVLLYIIIKLYIKIFEYVVKEG